MPFTTIPAYVPGKNKFNLSYTHTLTADLGQLIPVMCKRMIPGDTFEVSNQIVVRFQPMVAPILSEVNVYCHTFFVPERILFNSWNNTRKCNEFDDKALELFLTGGPDGNDDSVSLPLWTGVHKDKGTIWDRLGLPIGTHNYTESETFTPVAFPRNAYNKIYNDFYRDETLQDEVRFDNEEILYRNLKKDYFTSALPWQQRGTSPALPISGNLPVKFETGEGISATHTFPNLLKFSIASGTALGGMPTPMDTVMTSVGNGYGIVENQYGIGAPIGTVNLENAATFDVSDLRLAFQIQKWLERNARGGVRLNEFLLSHFGTSPNDDTLQRAVYVGGSKSPIVVSEVAQTSETVSGGTAQGNLAGKALSADVNYQGKYYAREFGWIMTIMSVVPRLNYSSQGIPRELQVRTRYDYPFPEFVNLSEQDVRQSELYIPSDGNRVSNDIFGYQGRFDEFRHSQGIISGDMRDKLSYWHLNVSFANAPLLNSDFISWKGKDLKRIFAVQDEPCMVIQVGNVIDALRPLPEEAIPGLIDHN